MSGMVRNVVGILALSAWGLLASAASAQDWAEKMFAHQEYDFGSVARGALAEHKFPVKNLYKEDVHLSSVTSSCGCT
ncbi:MAG: DUF1573 domain-containing protein, partial [Planctomycetia bacterium]|nr:DUF1573 domain-containing protein [Planctomycetia bacterium]